MGALNIKFKNTVEERTQTGRNGKYDINKMRIHFILIYSMYIYWEFRKKI